MQIPKIIHQIWGGPEPLPEHFQKLSETWKEHHPDWQYEFWDDARIEAFVQTHYPQYWERFNDFTFNMQRWDTIRYFVLYKMGGMYLDFDTECLESLEPLIKDKSCWFSLEPLLHAQVFDREIYLSTALMGATAGHPFMKKVYEHIFDNYRKLEFVNLDQKGRECLKTTGPLVVTELYEAASPQEQAAISLIPAKYLSPFDKDDCELLMGTGEGDSDKLNDKIQDAYAVHYFFNDWLRGKNHSS